MSSRIYQYFVEGECEEKFLNTFKIPPYSYYLSGKVSVFNFINKKISNQRLLALNPKTIIILVYDIDTNNTDILEENIKKLNDFGFETYHIQSINNFEAELVYSSKIKNINELFKTTSKEEFKNKFIHHSNIPSKLEEIRFDHSKMWSRKNNNAPFNKYVKEFSITKK